MVVKIGTSTLAHTTGRLNIQRMEKLCKVLSDLKNAGHEIILVSSGAIGMGVGKLSLTERPKDMPTKQAAAAVGQGELMYIYDKLFTEYNHIVAQMLIDYPILQGEDNLSYINTDVYGSFALAGSIFLDSRCDNTFHDAYALVYGHHMDNGRMFGDLDKYKDGKFFGENSAGALILPDRSYKLEIFACMLVPAAEGMIFDTQMRQTDIGGLLDFAEAEAVHLRPDTVEAARGAESPQIIALSTCSSEYTDARTIVLAYMTPYTTETQVGG